MVSGLDSSDGLIQRSLGLCQCRLRPLQRQDKTRVSNNSETCDIVTSVFAAIEFPDRLCIIRWVGRVRLHVEALTICGQRADAGDGVVQVPLSIQDGRGVPSISEPRRLLRLCAACKQALAG